MSVHLKAKEQGQCKAWSWSCNSYKSQSYKDGWTICETSLFCSEYFCHFSINYIMGSNKPYKTQSHKDCVFVMNGMP